MGEGTSGRGAAASGKSEGGTGGGTARANLTSWTRLTHGSKPFPCGQADTEGPYGIRTRAAAVRGRCLRPHVPRRVRRKVGEDARGWRAFLTDDDQAAVYCSECGTREFDNDT